ncbi:MAG: CoB--CoM heterodisulfide reductase iron-sulfur subunit B family protein [Candidatus Bathyarchaeia archaeon]
MGCQVPARINYCDLSVRRVAEALGIELIDLQGAGCCGCYLRSIDFKAALILSSRILALAEKSKMDLVVLCNSCFSTLVETNALLEEKPELLEMVNEYLASEGLEYRKGVRVKDALEVYYKDYGIEKIKPNVVERLEGLKAAAHYGCHILRPSRKTKFDNPEAPHILDDLVEVTGAESVYWSLKLWCCGFPTMAVERDMGLMLARNKLRDAVNSGAQCIVTTCPSCQITFDLLQPTVEKMYNESYGLPVLYCSQLLGLALGLKAEDVGLSLNRVPTKHILNLLK